MISAEKKKQYAAALADIATLEARWPQAFFLDQRKRRPIKCGIRQDIIAAGLGGMTLGQLATALRVYCSNKFYLSRLRPNAPRIGLNGELAGTVNSIDAARADAELMRRRVKAEARRLASTAADPVQGAGAPAPAPMAEPERPRRLTLTDLKQQALARKGATA